MEVVGEVESVEEVGFDAVYCLCVGVDGLEGVLDAEVVEMTEKKVYLFLPWKFSSAVVE